MSPRGSNGLTFLDFFAGFGGSSSGLVEAGFELATAYNHWDKAIVAAPNVSLVIPSRTRPESMYEGELPFDLDDVRFRMLGPTEHLRAQRFWEGYDTSAANKSETTKGAGNAVPVNVAHWIGDFVAEALGTVAA